MNGMRNWMAGAGITLALAGGMVSTTSQAALVDQGNGTILDTTTNLIWLKDANYVQTSGYDADGRMNWTATRDWAANLNFGGSSEWRLPTTLQPDPSCSGQFNAGGSFGLQGFGFDCTGSEMGRLFYNVLGGKQGAIHPHCDRRYG